jgi:two-component system sensor histidine kinase UhpB
MSLPTELNNTCCRVVQEAVTNVLRHAHAQHIWVELRGREDEVRLAIRDDGVGFDPGDVRRRARIRRDSLGRAGGATPGK